MIAAKVGLATHSTPDIESPDDSRRSARMVAQQIDAEGDRTDRRPRMAGVQEQEDVDPQPVLVSGRPAVVVEEPLAFRRSQVDIWQGAPYRGTGGSRVVGQAARHPIRSGRWARRARRCARSCTRWR